MRVLFLVHNLGKTRHFESVIQRLTRRGHTVVLAAARKRKGLKATRTLHVNKRVEITPCPVHRVDNWEALAGALRRARDYVRFLDPRYGRATKLAARAAVYAPDGFSRFVERRPWIRRHWRAAAWALSVSERAIPHDRFFELFIKSERPDVVLVTPLVDFGSYQTDYVKAAHALGVPVVFLPFSWDNLTNRGLIRVPPDRVLVWNDLQKREAIELHDVPDERVIVTGAPRFDDFFRMRPSMSRGDFCATVGLDPSRPFMLYVCSSQFVAADREVEFVRQWIAELRSSAEPALRGCGVLVRPHPAHQEQWATTDLSDLPAVSRWSLKSTMNADQGLYDSISHASAVVGLNTSAMIEASILGKPVHTLEVPEFFEGQAGTLHFSYLLEQNGGPVSLSRSFAEHHEQLARALDDAAGAERRTRGFVESFVRPRGRKVAPTKVMVEEIEAAARIRKRRQRPPLWAYPLRWCLFGYLKGRQRGATREPRQRDHTEAL